MMPKAMRAEATRSNCGYPSATWVAREPFAQALFSQMILGVLHRSSAREGLGRE